MKKIKGLSGDEVSERQKKFGYNEIRTKEGSSFKSLF